MKIILFQRIKKETLIKRKYYLHGLVRKNWHSHPRECLAGKILCGAQLVGPVAWYLYPTALLVAVCRARDDDRGVKYSILKRARRGKEKGSWARARLIQHPQGSNSRHATLRILPFPPLVRFLSLSRLAGLQSIKWPVKYEWSREATRWVLHRLALLNAMN